MNEVLCLTCAARATQTYHLNDQAKSFTLGTREVISWKSQDGTTIEGILIKPQISIRQRSIRCFASFTRAHRNRSAGAADSGRALLSVRHLAARGALILKVTIAAAPLWREVS